MAILVFVMAGIVFILQTFILIRQIRISKAKRKAEAILKDIENGDYLKCGDNYCPVKHYKDKKYMN